MLSMEPIPSAEPFLRRVILKNYRSIGACDVRLGRLMFLVGPNGSGKSNFLDSLRFVADALRTTLDHALRDRSGINEVRRRSGGHPTHFSIRIDFCLRNGDSGQYFFRIGAQPQGGYEVQEETCSVLVPSRAGSGKSASFAVKDGMIQEAPQEVMPPVATDRLYLVHASGLPEFRPAYEALSRMGFYNLNPDRIRDLQSPDPGQLLSRDGGNIASVLSQLEKQSPETKQRIQEYLSRIVPGISQVAVKTIGGSRETLEFRQAVVGARNPWSFLAANMSDGTLRALGVLTSLFQAANGAAGSVPLVGIEEPEAALHPGAAGVLRDALKEASQSKQVLVTSHSPDLLDDPTLDPQSILAVLAKDGETRIGPLNDVTRRVLHDRLYTAGELIRMETLEPAEGALPFPEEEINVS